MKRYIETKIRLPKDFVTRPSEPGTSAYEYLQGRRDPNMLLEDDDLMFVVDDQHALGGMIYVFKDRSSVVFAPRNN